MNLVERDRALRTLRLSGMADVLETRLGQAQSERLAPLDLVSALVTDVVRVYHGREPLAHEDAVAHERHAYVAALQLAHAVGFLARTHARTDVFDADICANALARRIGLTISVWYPERCRPMPDMNVGHLQPWRSVSRG